jgi:hypothetical protein
VPDEEMDTPGEAAAIGFDQVSQHLFDAPLAGRRMPAQQVG